MSAKGIRFNEKTGKWQALLYYGGKSLSFGSYKTFEEAVRAKRAKADMYRLGLSDEDLFGCPMSELLDKQVIDN